MQKLTFLESTITKYAKNVFPQNKKILAFFTYTSTSLSRQSAHTKHLNVILLYAWGRIVIVIFIMYFMYSSFSSREKWLKCGGLSLVGSFSVQIWSQQKTCLHFHLHFLSLWSCNFILSTNKGCCCLLPYDYKWFNGPPIIWLYLTTWYRPTVDSTRCTLIFLSDIVIFNNFKTGSPMIVKGTVIC